MPLSPAGLHRGAFRSQCGLLFQFEAALIGLFFIDSLSQ
jgi:hypothetical protein